MVSHKVEKGQDQDTARSLRNAIRPLAASPRTQRFSKHTSAYDCYEVRKPWEPMLGILRGRGESEAAGRQDLLRPSSSYLQLVAEDVCKEDDHKKTPTGNHLSEFNSLVTQR